MPKYLVNTEGRVTDCEDTLGKYGSVVKQTERALLVRSDVIGLVAGDLVLRLIGRSATSVSLVVKIRSVNLGDLARNVSRFGVPRHVIANLELRCHLKPLVRLRFLSLTRA